ncbi:MAG: MFS transporter [Gemmatimonadota bacterium]
MRPLLGVTLNVVGAISMLPGALSPWAAQDLGVSARNLGLVFTSIGVLSVRVQGGLLGRLTTRVGAEALTRTGTLLLVIALVLIPFLPTVRVALVPLAFYGVGSALFSPSISNLVTRTTGPNERGAVLGVFQGMSSLGRVVGRVAASAKAALARLRLPFRMAATVSLGGVFLVQAPSKLPFVAAITPTVSPDVTADAVSVAAGVGAAAE